MGKVTIEDRAEFGGALFNRFKELAETESDTSEQIGEIGVSGGWLSTEHTKG